MLPMALGIHPNWVAYMADGEHKDKSIESSGKNTIGPAFPNRINSPGLKQYQYFLPYVLIA